MNNKKASLFVIGIMGFLCLFFAIMLLMTLHSKKSGLIKIFRIIICIVCIIFFGYVFINLLAIMPKVLAS